MATQRKAKKRRTLTAYEVGQANGRRAGRRALRRLVLAWLRLERDTVFHADARLPWGTLNDLVGHFESEGPK